MTTCIYCAGPGPFGREHYIPRALGTFRGLKPLADKICEKPCGDELGKLDQAIVRNSPDALFRVLAGVSGRSAHESASPFYYGSFSGQTTHVRGPHPRLGCDVLWEIEPGTMHAREANQIILRRGDEHFAFPLPDKGIEEYLRFIVREHDLKGAAVVAVFAGDGEENELRTETVEAIKAVATATEGASITSAGPIEPGHRVRTEAVLPITQMYMRGIAKIAFHYLLAHAGHVFTGHESVFDDVKRYVKTGEGFEDRITLAQLPIAEDLRQFPGALRFYAHTVDANVDYNEIVMRVQLFAGPAIMPPTWLVRLARNPSYVYTAAFGHAFVLTGDTGDGHQGEVSELTSISHIVLPRRRQ